jgi:hypothetical protein
LGVVVGNHGRVALLLSAAFVPESIIFLDADGKKPERDKSFNLSSRSTDQT